MAAGAASNTTGGLFWKVDFTRAVSGGFNESLSTGSRDEIDGLYDLDGDGKPDQVYMDGDTVRALYNQATPGALPATMFAPRAAPITGLPAMAHEGRYSWSIGTSGQIGPASSSASYAESSARSARFLTDVDGDGFIDYLRAGHALRGQPFGGGMRFEATPYSGNLAIDPTRDPVLAGFKSDLAGLLIEHDPVVAWIAPESGHVIVRGTTAKARAGGTDGVTVELYHQNALEQQLAISPSDTTSHDFPALQGIDVTAGDELYLRLKSGPDASVDPDGNPLDALNTRLFVTYDQICHLTCDPVADPYRARAPTGEPILAFDSQAEFRIAGSPAYAVATVDGTLALHATLAKTPSAADLRVCVQRYPRATPSFSPSLDVPCDASGTAATNLSGTVVLPAAQSVSQMFDLAIPVSFGEIILVRVESDFSFDPSAEKLVFGPSMAGVPALAYTTVCTPDANGANVCSSDPTEIADAQLSTTGFGPSVALVPSPSQPLVVPQDTTLVFDPLVLGDNFVLAVRSDLRGLIQQVDCRGVSCATIHLPATSVSAGESVSFEVVGDSVFSVAVTGSYLSGGSFTATLHRRATTPSPPAPTPFVGGYRGWKATMWNEAEPFAPATLLSDYAAIALLPEPELERLARTASQPIAAFPPGAAAHAPSWTGMSSLAFVSATSLHASFVGSAASSEDGGLFTGGYSRLSGTRSISFANGLGVAKKVFGLTLGANLDFNVGVSWTKTTTDIVDLNGDGIADVLAGDDTFFGSVGPGVHPPIRVGGFEVGDGFRQRTSMDYGFGLGSGVSRPVINSKGRTVSQDVKDRTTGIGFSSGTGYAIGRSETTRDLHDVNGDGLPDLLRRSGSTIYVRYNLGNRFGEEDVLDHLRGVMLGDNDGFESTLEDTVPFTDSTSDALSHDTTITTHETQDIDLFVYSYSKNSRQTSERTTRQVVDLNGDGLPDLLFKNSGQTNVYVQYNLGGSFADPIAWDTPSWSTPTGAIEIAPPLGAVLSILGLTGADVLAGSGSIKSTSSSHTVSIPIPYTPLTIGGNYATSHEVDNYELALVDLDGDGAPEHVLRRQTVNGTPTMYIKRNLATGRANLLSRVSRPLGSSFSLDYTRTANTVDLPHSRHVLSRVELDDGSDLGPGYESPNLVATMSYADGFYSRNEKTFFGFGTVTTTRTDGGTVTDLYENRTFPLHGRLLSETRRDGAARMFHQHAIRYSVLAVRGAEDLALSADPSCIATLHPLLALDACLAVFPVVTRDDDTRAEGGTLAKMHRVSDSAHDRFGNVLTSLDEADDVIATDDVYATAQYQNDTTRWILGRPTSLEVRAGSAGGAVLRSRSGTYDANGRPTSLVVDTGTGIATTQIGYDGYGNLVHLETPPNELAQPQTFDVAFDPTTRSYPSSMTDGFGLTSTMAYDLRYGISTLEVDTNGAQRSQTLDGFGRVTTVFGPYDTSAPALAMSYFPNEVQPRAVTVTRASAPSDYTGPVPAATTTVAVTNGSGEPIELRKTAVVGGVTGMTTLGLMRHDVLGRGIAGYYPFFTAGASTSFVAPMATLATTTSYDVIDRPVTTSYPDGTLEVTNYALAASPSDGLMFRTQMLDGNGDARETYTDLLGRTRSFTEHPTAASTSVTGYDYLPTGELSKIVDAEGTVSQLAYDRRGLRLSMTNPDTGLVTDRYDLMGNRVGLTEPNHRAAGAEVKFRYDRDRLAAIDYPSKPDVAFSYGAAGASEFRAGRLVEVTDETGSQQHFYGAMGEVRRTLRTVVDPAHPSQAAKLFDFRYTTDSLARQLRVQYPDGERVTTTYDAAGMPASVAGAGTSWTKTYVDQLRYDVFGNRAHARFGNGVATDWTFDPQRIRLTAAVTTLPSATRVQDLHYLYDPVGNPTSIQNTLPAPPANGKLPGTSGATFSYDGVDRLTHAVGNGDLPGSKRTTYDLGFAYSASHNLTHKQLQHLVINSAGNGQAPADTNFSSDYLYAARPHLPSQVGGNDLTYDPSGNLIRRQTSGTGTHQDYVWDDDGRLVQVTGQGANQRNVYDVSGVRVVRDGIGGTTVFASPLYEVGNNNAGQKHVFVGSTRIASVFKSYASTATPALPVQPGTAYFFHGDHLGSSGAVTKDDGTLNDAHDYFPDGEIWITSGPKDAVNGYLFNGKPLDPDTGFYDFGQRFYDPKISLWLGIDPAFVDDARSTVGVPMMLAPAVFAGHSPARFKDPDGRCPWCLIPFVVGAIIGSESTLEEPSPSSWEIFKGSTRGAIGASLFMAAGPIGGAVRKKLLEAGASKLVSAGLGGGTAGIVGNVGVDVIRGDITSPGGYATAFGIGATFGVAGELISSKVAPWLAGKLRGGSAGGVSVQNFGGPAAGQRIGVINVGASETGVAFESRAPGGLSHQDLSKKAFGPLGVGERRIGLTGSGEEILVRESSTGYTPVAGDLPDIARALKAAGINTGNVKVLIGKDWVPVE